MSNPILDIINKCKGQGNKRTGLILIPPSIAPCDCYDTVILPTSLLLKLGKKTIKEIGEKYFAAALNFLRKSALLEDLRIARSAVTEQYEIYKNLYDKVRTAIARKKFLPLEISDLRKKIADLEKIINSAKSARLIELDKMIANAKKLKLKIELEIKRLIAMGLNQNDPTIKAKLDDLNNARFNLENAENARKIELDKLAPGVLDEQNRLLGQIEIKKNELAQIEAGLPKLQRKLEEETKKWHELDAADKAIENDLKNVDSAGVRLDEKYPTMGQRVLDFILDSLNLLDVVQKHTCQDPAMLNQETCECTECPQGKTL
jgi:chromosome segregation ATPase